MGNDLRVEPGKKINLRKIDPGSKKGVPEREAADRDTAKSVERIGELQYQMYAEGKHSLLVILQGMDTSGKDGTVRRVFDAVNPTGVAVTSFKTPTALEARHDYLWRCHASVPARGDVGIFNRSYYEDVLIVRVHADRFLPPELQKTKHLWETRYELINEFEKLLTMNGTTVLKFVLHISKAEQARRFRERQEDSRKHWKLAAGDFEERKFWDDYQDAYEQMLPATSTKIAPWYIVPADHKWVRNYHISRIVREALEGMKLRWPEISDRSLIRRRFK